VGLIRVSIALALMLALAVAWAAGRDVATAQSTAQTWTVQVGGDDPANNLEPQAFFPDPMIIHVGDTVNFRWAGFHTVTFNSFKPELPLIVPGSSPGELMAGPAFLPVGVTDPSKPVTYDGTQQVNSGAPLSGPPEQMRFSMTFTRAGTFGYVCSVHPGMRGNIEVREAGAPLPESPDQAIQRGQLTRGALLAKIQADLRTVNGMNAGTVHTAAAGVGDTFGVSADVFMPGNVTVRRGDSVVWYWPDPFNIHTVTFSSGAAPPEFIVPRPQASGPPALVIPANVASPTGGTTYTGQGYLNSGVLGGNASFAVTVDAPPGTYTYYCIIHGSPEGGMRGTITVTG
jgi:plastocyanin